MKQYIPPQHNTENPPGQIVNRPEETPRLYKWPSFDRYPWLKTSMHEDQAGWDRKSPSKAPISPAKRLGDIIDRVVASSSEPASKGSYDDGYRAGWDAAIEAAYKQQLKDF